MTGSLRRLRCDHLATMVAVPERPQRIVSLVSGFTEALWDMGLADRVVGVSRYCRRYVDTGDRPVVGDYLRIDEAALRALAPDLVLMTDGVQAGVARALSRAGFPVLVVPVPASVPGVVDNVMRLGALTGAMAPARTLADRLLDGIAALRAAAPADQPLVYAELWFGRHPRMAGGAGFIDGIIALAGGRNLGADLAEGWPRLDLDRVVRARPPVVVLFHEADDHPLDVAAWRAERRWDWPFTLIESGIDRGRNLIHDGPSLLETARWLAGELRAASAYRTVQA